MSFADFTGTFIAQLITLLIVIALLYRYAGPAIAKTLKERSRRIETTLSQAVESQRRARETTQETERQLVQAREESAGIVASAQRAAEAQRVALDAQARQDAENVTRRARDVIGRERQAAVDELRREAGLLAVSAARQVVKESLDEGSNRSLSDRVISDVGGKS